MEKKETAMLLSGQTAIITGASGGLGQHISLSLAHEGANLVIVYKNNFEKAVAIKEKIEALGRSVLLIQADVTSEADIQQMVNGALTQFSRIDILINNAGISMNGLSWKLPRDTWQQVIDVNLTGPLLCIKHVLPTMRSQNYGRIINISSVVGQIGVIGTSPYAASKSGLIGLTKTVAREVAQKGITVNAMSLGYFDEGMLYSLPPTILENILKEIPVGRFGTMDELTWAVRFLCAPQAGYITGAVLNINGGFYM